MHVVARIVVEHPIRPVFTFAANPCCWSEWITGVAPVQQTWRGPLDIGTTFFQVDAFAGFRDTSTWEVTEYEPPRVFACRRVDEPCGAMRLLCESLGSATRMTLASEEAAGLFVSGPEVARAARARMERDLAVLKQLLEARLVALIGHAAPPIMRSQIAHHVARNT